MYPLKFNPILKPIIWGGEDICKFKNIQAQQAGIGESWEISGVAGDVSVVSNGELAGKSLNELIELSGEKLLGKPVFERFGNTFPLLIKFIDAKQALSIQVHPDDELAKKRHNSFGKTEMWYVVKTSGNASLYSGFKEEIDAEKYVQSLEDDTFINYLQEHQVAPGDVFFLPAGRVHAIGAGCFIAEIQQTSNITYRIYDYNRKDKAGNPRELHTELAKNAIDYKVYSDYKLNYPKGKTGKQNLVECPYFNTNLIEAGKNQSLNILHQDTFAIYICLEGRLQLIDNQNNKIEIQQGESILVPAETASRVQLIFETGSKLLETYIGHVEQK
ncbi:MAG: mannose-6-phosphate isomerase [Dysgonamonadaceae bacterium]|jgi:mannose-6-phosphate isomerase|nr:mannose-6-phosphate isomerase [Dysgonamonadaceae bacterium]